MYASVVIPEARRRATVVSCWTVSDPGTVTWVLGSPIAIKPAPFTLWIMLAWIPPSNTSVPECVDVPSTTKSPDTTTRVLRPPSVRSSPEAVAMLLTAIPCSYVSRDLWVDSPSTIKSPVIVTSVPPMVMPH